MAFVEDFCKNPTKDSLLRCTKEQLISIAEHYSVTITSDDKKLKAVLLEKVEKGLIDKNIIAKAESVGSPSNLPQSPTAELSFKMQEYNLEGRKLQLHTAQLRADREAMALREKELEKEVRLRQLEVDKEIELRKLEQQERENQKKMEFQREREEREFNLRKLELEYSAKYSAVNVSPIRPPSSPPLSTAWQERQRVPFVASALPELPQDAPHNLPSSDSPAPPFDDEKFKSASHALVLISARIQPGDKV
ncbi:uncharacterized protein LOC130523356 [Takifugu flavidus]|uniref:uncharacterized protein LOC130523356 n=1 Tax=Takifugu flavidus TaxID=433684 RepID=UPI00254492A3|nr:uncharacterized protein LOC130523356 [Takifugu flavidus]